MQHIDCDALAHSLYCSENPVYPEIYNEIKSCFGEEVCEEINKQESAFKKKHLPAMRTG